MPEAQDRVNDCALKGSVALAAAEDLPQGREGRDLSRLVAGTGIALGGKLAGRGIRLLVDIVLARVLGPLAFGLYAIGWTITRVVTLISPLGLNVGVVRFGAKYWRRDDARFKGVIAQSLRVALLSGLVLGVAFYLGASWVGQGIFHKPEVTPVVRCFAFTFPLVTLLTVVAAATRVSQRMKYSVLAEDISQPAADLLLILVLLYAWKQGLAGAISACVLSFGIAVFLAVCLLKRLFPEVASSRLRSISPGKGLLVFSLPASLTGVFGVLLIWVDRLFVGYFRPPADVGIYQAASQLSVSLAIVLGAFGAIFSPMAADFFHRGEMGRLEELFRVSTKWGLYLSLPPFLVMLFASRQVMTVLYGSPYAAGWSALVILGFGQVVNAGTGPVGLLLVMTGHQNHMFMISGTMFAVSVILGLILIPRWGMAGAACATACALSGLFITAVALAHRALRMRPYDRRYSKGLLATALAASALFLVRRLGIASPSLVLLLSAVVAIGVFGLTLAVIGVDAEDREFVGLIRDQLKMRLT